MTHLDRVLESLRAELEEERRAADRQRLHAWVMREALRYSQALDDKQQVESLLKSLR